jgi:hypothetical protein
MSNEFGVLSPWADTDPIPLKGLGARINGLAGKKIGLFYNIKRSAGPIVAVVEKNLKAKYPTVETFVYPSKMMDTMEVDGAHKEKFAEWLKGVDAVIGAVGD